MVIGDGRGFTNIYDGDEMHATIIDPSGMSGGVKGQKRKAEMEQQEQ